MFTNLYTKSTANPKDIDFATVGTRVKNKIPDAAIKAFRAKVPAPLPKPFEFTFDKDYDTGKLQITVKQLGFVHAWFDESFVANKSKMISVEVDIETWKTHIKQSVDALAHLRGEMDQLATRVGAIEGIVASEKGDQAVLKEHQAVKHAVIKLMEDANAHRKGVLDFWNTGPKDGVLGLMKKHGLPVDQIGGERREADAAYALLQQGVKMYQDRFTALGKEVEALNKRTDDVGVKLLLQTNSQRDRKGELEMLQTEIQKLIGEIQGWKNSDFEGVGAKALLKDAKEFTTKAGAAWTKLSENPDEIDKTTAKVQEVFERMRVLGGRVVREYDAWQKPAIPRGGEMPKYQQMLKMVHDEYMADHTLLQNTLRAYKEAMAKQKPKAVEAVAKAQKKVAKVEAKQVKADAKAAKKAR